MSWLSSGLSNIGLGGLNTFWQNTAKPVLENPYVDIGLGVAGAGLGLGALGFGPAAGLFGGAEAAAGAGSTVGGIDALTTGAAVDAAGAGGAASIPTWSFPMAAADAGGAGGDLSGLVAGVPGQGGAVWTDAAGNAITAPGQGTTGLFDMAGSPPTVADSGGTALGGPSGWALSNPTPGQVADITGGGAAAAPTSQPGFFSNVGSNLVTGLEKNPLAPLGLAGLGYNLYQGYEQQQQMKALQAQIQQQSQQAQATGQQATTAAQPQLNLGANLETYLQNNTLPPDAQAALDAQVRAQKAQVIQGYGARGQNTDPTQNSALATDLANVDTQAAALKQQMQTQYFNAGQQAIQSANQLIASGLSATQISAQLPMAMQQLNIELGNQTSAAIAAFAKGLGGTGTSGSKTITIG